MKSLTRQAVWNKTGGHCYYCGLALTPDEVDTIEGRYNSWMDADHLLPKAKGGLDTLENMVPACKACNCAKGLKTLEEYRQYVAIKKSGRPNLTRDIVDWLDAVGFQFPALPVHRFWFELHLLDEHERSKESAA